MSIFKNNNNDNIIRVIIIIMIIITWGQCFLPNFYYSNIVWFCASAKCISLNMFVSVWYFVFLVYPKFISLFVREILHQLCYNYLMACIEKKDIVRGFLIFYGSVNTCIFVHLTWHCQSTSCQCALLRPVTSLVLTEKLHSF